MVAKRYEHGRTIQRWFRLAYTLVLENAPHRKMLVHSRPPVTTLPHSYIDMTRSFRRLNVRLRNYTANWWNDEGTQKWEKPVTSEIADTQKTIIVTGA